jgi:hypothetical protein
MLPRLPYEITGHQIGYNQVKRTHMKKRFPILLLLLLTACQSLAGSPIPAASTPAAQATLSITQTTMAPTSTQAPALTPVPIVTQFGPSNFPADVDPLTGLVVADPSLLDRRPVMVKVSNFPREGRPHAGLSQADLVFEYSTGGGWNRFLAVYYGQNAEKVGPVRSGRIVDKWLVSMYQGVLGMMFASDEVFDQIRDQLGIERVVRGTDHTCPALCNLHYDNPIYSWFANTAEMTAYYEKNDDAFTGRPNLDGMVFSTAAPAGGTPGSVVTLHYGGNNEGQWKYDAATQKYLRWIDHIDKDGVFEMIPLVDRNTGEQLAFSNVIVLFANYKTLNAKDSMHEIDLAGEQGRAMIFRGGQLFEGTWKSASAESPIQFFDAAGARFTLQPGPSWIAIMDPLSKVSQDPQGVYFINFRKASYLAK